MEKNNSKGGLVVGILIGIVLMLVVGMGLFVTNTVSFSSKTSGSDENQTSDDNNVTNTDNSTQKTVGEYTYSKEYSTDGVVYSLTLDLMDDGTFYVAEGATTGFYSFGTYEISGSSIKFNTQFKMSNVPGEFSKENKMVTYEIDSEGKIVVNNISDSPFNGNGNEKFSLAKSSDDCKIVKDFTKHTIELLDIQKNNTI